MDREIFDTLQNSRYRIEFYNENLEVTLFSGEAFRRQFHEWYVRKYSDRRPDVIVTVGPAALQFMLEVHEGSFKDTPVVFCGIMEIPAGVRANSRFTGAWSDVQTEKTLDVALRLQPDTKHVVVVGGVGSLDRQGQAIVREKLRAYESKVDSTYLTDLSMPDLLERLKVLPRDTIVMHTAITEDAAGERFIDATQAVPMVAKAASVPVFVLDDVDVGTGAVGGDVLSWAATSRDAAKIALRILDGEKPQDIPIVRSDNVFMFDWPALQRWGFKESDLPPGSQVLNRETSFWETFKWYIISGVSLMLVEALLIFGLLWQRSRLRKTEAERRQAEQLVRESEQRFRLVASTAPVMIWMSAPNKLCNYVNQPWIDFTGRPLETELGSGWAQGLHPEDVEDCLKTYTEAFDRREPFKKYYRLRRHDGEYRWVFDTGVPRYNPDGSFAGYIGSCLDVTEQKLAEEALAGIGRKLIEAHEEERVWIARELHDDITQRLALVALQMNRRIQHTSRAKNESQDAIQQALRSIEDIARDVQGLSHRLHSSKLEYLGLAVAAASFCRELSEQKKVDIDFRHVDMPPTLPHDLALCLFRVLQEALQNAVKHSDTRYFKVELRGASGDVQLTVSDLGVGFDKQEAASSPGLGLISMRERVRLVNGEFSLESKPGNGTTITVRVPLRVEQAKAATSVG